MRYLLLIILSIFLTNCTSDDNNGSNDDDDFNVFSVQKDKELGKNLSEQIESDTSDFDVLDSSLNPEPYEHLYRIRKNLLNSGEIKYQDEFAWRMRIVKDDSTLNAFATPGGYIYFYTGLIQFLENEAQFAGVMGHEMAHADRRHSTDQLTKQYGIQLLVGLTLGKNPGILVEIASGLATKKFSRDDESEADEFAVIYLNPTQYDARAAGGFFKKLQEEGQTSGVPQFLSTHPNPDNRVEAINDKWKELGSKAGDEFPNRYSDFQNTLP